MRVKYSNTQQHVSTKLQNLSEIDLILEQILISILQKLLIIILSVYWSLQQQHMLKEVWSQSFCQSFNNTDALKTLIDNELINKKIEQLKLKINK